MNPSTRDIRIQIDSRIELIDMIQQVTDDISRAAGFRPEAVLNVGLAVREAVINAIKHGNQQEPGKRVEIFYRLRPDKLVVVVRDEGAGFDFDGISDPLDPHNIFKSYGRGIFFMRSFVDRVAFSRRNGGGTEVVMEKQREKRRRGRREKANKEVRQEGGV
jgi:serine/threonine-protein kinase RsbW